MPRTEMEMKEKQQYMAVATVRKFVEPSAKREQLGGYYLGVFKFHCAAPQCFIRVSLDFISYFAACRP